MKGQGKWLVFGAASEGTGHERAEAKWGDGIASWGLVVLGLVNKLCEVGQSALGSSRSFGLIVKQMGRVSDLKLQYEFWDLKLRSTIKSKI